MNRIFLCAFVLILMTVMNPFNALGDEDQLIRNSLKQFFSVLKSGNVNAIESAIEGEILEETKVLLRNNKEYGQFLRQYYQGAEFQLENIVQVPDGAVVDVNVVFNNKDSERVSFFLIKKHANKKGDARWKVVRQQYRLSHDSNRSTELDIQ